MKLKPHEKKSMLKSIADFRAIVEAIKTETHCMDCLAYEQGYCQHWQAKVPVENTPNGCAEWTFNENSPPF